MRPRLLILLATLTAATACGDLFGPQVNLYRGKYFSAFEASGFTSCGRSDSWWVVDRSGQLGSRLPPYDQNGATAAYLEVRGYRRGPGKFGHMGASQYEFVIEQVITVDADTTGKCR